VNDTQKIALLEAELASLKAKYSAPAVSPLAPRGGFPDLPAVKGVRFASAAAGVKYTDRQDVMLMECAAGSSVAGVFTKSATRSANVLDCQKKLKLGASAEPVAILVNSGNSNAFTGRQGDESVDAICQAVSDVSNISGDRVFTASTGVIGERLPHDRIVSKVTELHSKLSEDGAEGAARAIMTTDTFPKGSAQSLQIDGETVQIVGFAKGSGMIAPDMATMLVYIATDASVDQDVLQSILSGLNEATFNSITVDSDTSTSDSLMLVASGQSAAPRITDANSDQASLFSSALNLVMTDLSQQVVRDGEGATKFIEIGVKGAASDPSAKTVALAIANSPLVKTAVAGEDPNWGRVVMGVGKSGEPADRDKLSIWFGDVLVAENGWVSPDYTEEAGAAYMKNTDLQITVDLGIGGGAATVWTCDLTHQYIVINADYRS
jgi:glutamate N-acetyltransferase/amino-acid N-acetyltransferase